MSLNGDLTEEAQERLHAQEERGARPAAQQPLVFIGKGLWRREKGPTET